MISFFLAQIQPVEPTNVNQVQQEFVIDGGELAGDNIFHTFEQFNLDQGQIVEFLANPQTRNIFNRVIGGEPSIIDGILKVTGGNPDFYFLNSNGIVFGRSAYIDVPAAFYGSTASSVQFGNSGFPRYREESEWFASPVAEGSISLVSNVSSLEPSFLAFQTLTNPVINLGTIQAGGRIDLSGSSIVSLGSLNAPEVKFSLIRLSSIGYKVSVDDDFWTILPRNYIPVNFLDYQDFYVTDSSQVSIATYLGSRTVSVIDFDLESFDFQVFDIGLSDSLSNQQVNIFRLGNLGQDFLTDLNLAIQPDLSDDLIVDDPVDELPDDPVTELLDDPVTELLDDPVTELPDDPVDELPDDPVTELPDDPVTELSDDPVTELSDDPVTELPDDLVTELPDDLVSDVQTEAVTLRFIISDFLKTEPINFFLPSDVCYYPQLVQGDRHCLLRLNNHSQSYLEMTEKQFLELISDD